MCKFDDCGKEFRRNCDLRRHNLTHLEMLNGTTATGASNLESDTNPNNNDHRQVAHLSENQINSPTAANHTSESPSRSLSKIDHHHHHLHEDDEEDDEDERVVVDDDDDDDVDEDEEEDELEDEMEAEELETMSN